MTDVNFRLEGKTALVTGASRGIGQAIAETFAQHGAHVVLASRSEEALAQVAAGIRARGGKATVIPAHLGRTDEIATASRTRSRAPRSTWRPTPRVSPTAR